MEELIAQRGYSWERDRDPFYELDEADAEEDYPREQEEIWGY